MILCIDQSKWLICSATYFINDSIEVRSLFACILIFYKRSHVRYRGNEDKGSRALSLSTNADKKNLRCLQYQTGNRDPFFSESWQDLGSDSVFYLARCKDSVKISGPIKNLLPEIRLWYMRTCASELFRISIPHGF
jgi:hypothetical protein